MRTGRGAATVGPAGPRHAGGRGAVPIVASARVSLLSPCARARGQCGDPERKWPLHSEPTAWPGGVGGGRQACPSLGGGVMSITGTGVWDQRAPQAEGLASASPAVCALTAPRPQPGGT